MSKRVQTKEAFVNKNNLKPDIKEKPRGGIPAFSIGKPLKGDGRFDVCYLDFQNAYSKQLQKRQNMRQAPALPSGAGMGTTPGMRRH